MAATNEYRADHVGSLLRPRALLEARAQHEAGRLSTDELRAREDDAVLRALAKQREIGVDIVSDGEFRRGAWQTDMAYAVEGFATERMDTEWYGPGGGKETTRARVVAGPLRKTRRLTAYEVGFLREHAAAPYKMTLPSAAVFRDASYKAGVTDRFYPTRGDLLQALVEIVRDEIAGLVADGVPYVQIDAPRHTYYADPRIREQMQADGVDPDQALREAVNGDNASLEGVPRENVTIGFHLCRGNQRSRWHASGGYEPVAETIFGGLNVDRLLLEYDSDRAGGFEPLRFVPPGRTVVLGLVTTKSGQMEKQDDILRRIEEASRYVPIERLALSPQCGFASVAEGNLLTEDEQWRKLELIVDTARKVWG